MSDLAVSSGAFPRRNGELSAAAGGVRVCNDRGRPGLRAILAAASTGGPEALALFLKPLVRTGVTVPVFIVQHLLTEFTPVLASKLSHGLGCRCIEPEDGEEVCERTIYLAPGDHHMRLKLSGASTVRIKLDCSPPVNYCRPSADPLFLSAVEVYGARVMVAVLTGMGNDGLAGARCVSEAGGLVCAQDEASSAVWGMPGGVCGEGIASYVASPEDLGVWGSRFIKSGNTKRN